MILQCNHEVIPLSPASACAPDDGDNDDVSVTCCELRTNVNNYVYGHMTICQYDNMFMFMVMTIIIIRKATHFYPPKYPQ